jgi:signal transduction histidine kinase
MSQPHTPELTVLLQGEESTIPLLAPVVIGARHDADIVLEGSGILPTHLVVEPGGEVEVFDLEGQAAVRLNGGVVQGRYRLRHQDRLSVKDLTLVYLSPASRPDDGTSILVRPPAGRAASPRGDLWDSQTLFRFTSKGESASGEEALRTLSQLLKLTSTASSESSLVESVLDLARDGTNSLRGAVVQPTRDGALVALALRRGPEDPPGTRLPFDEGPLRTALTGKLVTEPEASDGVQFLDGRQLPAVYTPIMRSKTDPEAVLCVVREVGAAPYSRAEVDLLAALGRQLAYALQRVRVLKVLRERTMQLDRLQRRFSAVLQSISEGLVLVHPGGGVEPITPPSGLLLEQLVGEPVEPQEPLPEGSLLAAQVRQALSRLDVEPTDHEVGGRTINVSFREAVFLEGVVIVFRDVTEERQRESVLREAEGRLQDQLLTIGAREQRRIGCDLHDGVCQRLVGVGFMARLLEQRLADAGHDGWAAEVANILEQVDGTIDEARALAQGLAPVALEEHGLVSALEELAHNTQRRFQIRCRLERVGEGAVDDEAVATQLFLLAQEAVTNAVKHAQPQTITIGVVTGAEDLELTVLDDGHGMELAPRGAGGMGLEIMRYRAKSIGASFEVGTGETGGVRVRARWSRESAP